MLLQITSIGNLKELTQKLALAASTLSDVRMEGAEKKRKSRFTVSSKAAREAWRAQPRATRLSHSPPHPEASGLSATAIRGGVIRDLPARPPLHISDTGPFGSCLSPNLGS